MADSAAVDGIHDMGGMEGFGPVVVEADEPPFHEPWEGTALAIVQATRALGIYNIDESRHGIERMDPARYLAASYYERWLSSAETNLVDKGLVSREELDADAGRRDPDGPHREHPSRDNVGADVESRTI